MHSRKIKIGLLSLSLMLFGTACSTVPKKAVQAPLPPYPLVAYCPTPETPTERTVGGLIGYIVALQRALQECNDDKAALQVWYKSMRVAP